MASAAVGSSVSASSSGTPSVPLKHSASPGGHDAKESLQTVPSSGTLTPLLLYTTIFLFLSHFLLCGSRGSRKNSSAGAGGGEAKRKGKADSRTRAASWWSRIMGNNSVAEMSVQDGGDGAGAENTGSAGAEEQRDDQPAATSSSDRGPKKQFPEPTEARDPEKEWTFASLKEYDGETNRMYIGVCGHVFDVQQSDNFRPDFGYGKLWGGRDATYALAMLSLKPEDAARLDWSLGALADANKESLKSWLTHFEKKYEVVGKLAEYKGWDFSPLDAFAKEEERSSAMQ